MKSTNNIKFKSYLEYLYFEARITSILKFIELKPWTQEQKNTIKQLIEKNKTRAEQLSIDWQRKDLRYDDVYNELIRETKRQIKKDIRSGLANLKEEKDYIILLANNEYTAYIPLTYKASCAIGRNTKWCTAMENNQTYWEQYKNKNIKFIYILPDYIAIAVYPNISKIEIFDKYDNKIHNIDNILKQYGISQQLLQYVDKEIHYPDKIVKEYIKQKNIEKLKELLQSGIEVTEKMIHDAIMYNFLDILELLLKYKKPTLKILISSVISLIANNVNKNKNISKSLRLLIKYDALNISDQHIINAIELCIKYNYLTAFIILFKNYKQIILNNFHHSLDSYFSQIIYNNAVDILKYLYNNDIITDEILTQLVIHNKIVLSYAINRNNIEILQYLFNNKAIQKTIKKNKELQNIIIEQSLIYASKTMQKFLFDPKNNYGEFLDFTAKLSNKLTVFEVVLYQKRSLEIFQLLWKNNTVKKYYNNVNEVFLMAVTAHNYDVCKFLLETENINITYNNNKFLQEAVYLGYSDIVSLILEYDLDPRIENYKVFKDAIIGYYSTILNMLLKYTQQIHQKYKISKKVLQQFIRFAERYKSEKCKKIIEQYL